MLNDEYDRKRFYLCWLLTYMLLALRMDKDAPPETALVIWLVWVAILGIAHFVVWRR